MYSIIKNSSNILKYFDVKHLSSLKSQFTIYMRQKPLKFYYLIFKCKIKIL